MKSKLLVISICVCFSFVDIGCSGSKTVPPPPDQSDALGPVSQELTVRIFIDATVSMKGFVVLGSTTNYAQIFPCLESLVLRGWPAGKPKFYKFGTDVLPLKEREHLRAATIDFYNDRDINQETCIEKVIDYDAETDELTDVRPDDSTDEMKIIVTDLFQSESDVVLLMGKLKQEYIQKGLAIGVLGLRSQFDGVVYDVGVSATYFEYRSDENPESYRPFYLLMLGKHADIARYFEELKSSGLPFVSETSFIIFSCHLVHPLSSFEPESIDSTDSLQECMSLVRSGPRDEHLKQFRIHGKPEIAAFTATLKYSPLPYTVAFNPQDLEYQVAAKRCQPDKLLEDSEARQALSIEGTGLSDTELKFTAKLRPASLPAKGIYLYDVTLSPKESSYQMPIWCSRWDMGLIQDGSKTINLHRFLSDLCKATIQLHKPKIARFYCYIEKR